MASIFLMLLLLVSNMGFAVNSHVCMGEIVKTNVSLGVGSLDCGMNHQKQACVNKKDVTSSKIAKKGCCENRHQLLELTDVYKTQGVSARVNMTFVTAFVHVFVQQLFIPESNHFPFAFSSPPTIPKDLPVLYQAFLI